MKIRSMCMPHQIKIGLALQWRHNGRDCVSNHQRIDCLFTRLFRHRSKKTSKRRVIGFVRGIHRGSFNSQHKRTATRKISPFNDVIMAFDIYDTINNIWCECIFKIPILELQIILTKLYTAHSTQSADFTMTSSNGNIFRVTGHLYGEFTGQRWIPHTKASNVEFWCFLWSAPE